MVDKKCKKGRSDTLQEKIRSKNIHCVKIVQIRSYFWYVFSCIRIEYGDLRSKFGTGKYGPEITPYLDTVHAEIFSKKLKIVGIKCRDKLGNMLLQEEKVDNVVRFLWRQLISVTFSSRDFL